MIHPSAITLFLFLNYFTIPSYAQLKMFGSVACNIEILAKMPTCAVENNLELAQLKNDLSNQEVSSQTCCRLQHIQSCLRDKVGSLPQCQDNMEKYLKQEISHDLCEPSVWCLYWYEWPLILYIILIALAVLFALVIIFYFVFRKCRSRN